MSGGGGGAFNVNSAHPFENPTPASPLIEIVAMLFIPLAFVRTFGVMIGSKKQGWTLFAAVGAPTEGTETRFGAPGSALFGQAATASGNGAANASYDSFASLGTGVLLMEMMLGEVVPGGAGSGLYGLVVMALLAVFLGGLMVGTTPEFLKKRLHARHMKLVSLYADQRPGVVTAGTLRTPQPTFIVLIVGVTLLMVGLEYLPALALGPMVDALV